MCLPIFHDNLNLRTFDLRWISHTLEQNLKNGKVYYSTFLLMEQEEAKIIRFKRVITGKSWLFLHDLSGAAWAETRFCPFEMPK
jgi:hypothetical protein